MKCSYCKGTGIYFCPVLLTPEPCKWCDPSLSYKPFEKILKNSSREKDMGSSSGKQKQGEEKL